MKAKNFLLSIAALLTILAAATPAQADSYRDRDNRHQANDGRHKYVYYPERQVYYAPESRSWFWLNGGNWQVGATLPGQIRVNAGDGMHIILQSGRPYTQHVYVEQNYGRPWRAKHRHNVRHDHRDHRENRHDKHYKKKHKDEHKHGRGHGRGHND